MAKPTEPTNPFYIMLVIVGLIFVITACAYCVMAYRAVALQANDASSLMQFLDQYGLWLLGGELVLLAVATWGVMATDTYWTKRAERRNAQKSPE